MNMYRDMFVALPILKKLLALYKDAENQLMIRKYADYFKK